ncbi:hypothetical protein YASMINEVIRUS_1467 [Yasminevirus sp. GU-2018]|uniref:C2H2-type domain-containing protein n=1 Tax=Yasminevirus sp. GU-2018 TaxID=2420051 RepID=A0A5K0UB42_9VIRU|nr:hypothetical protein YASMINEVIRUS_1467 [Yasminevirus sp. GU-2018]
MVVHKCPNCDAEFSKKDRYDYHVKNNACKEKNFVCKFCDKKFATKTSMYRHVRENCKVKKQTEIEKEGILEKLLEENVENNKRIERLEKENKKLKQQMKRVVKNTATTNIVNNTKNLTNNNCTTNINKGTINNIILVGYGQEDLTKIDKSEVLKALKRGYFSTIKLTESVHFNPKHPEYHNVYISNMKDKYAMMFDGDEWTLTTKEDLINKIYEDKKNYIEENLEEFVDSLPISRKKALERWLETDDEDPKIKEIKDNIKLLLYNSRKMITDKDKTVIKSKSIKKVKDE